MGLGYVYMDLPYGNKKERMEPESALCWKSEQARQSLWLHRADKVTLAIKSLHFHQNLNVRQSKQLSRMEKLMENDEMCLCFLRTGRQSRPGAHSDAAAFGFFQLRVNLQV